MDIAINVLDKILPWGIKKFLPLVSVTPKKLLIKGSDWTSQYSFYLRNQSNKNLFDIYLSLEGENVNFECIKIEKTHLRQEFDLEVNDIVINYEFARFDLVDEDNKNVIVLKIAQIDEHSKLTFQLKSNVEAEIFLKVLSYSKEQPKVVFRDGQASIPFNLPTKLEGRKFGLKNQTINMRRKN